MARQLSEREVDSLRELEDRFEEKLEEYKNLAAKRSKEELRAELEKVEAYLEGCAKSEIDDVEVNIRFKHAQARVLRELISDQA